MTGRVVRRAAGGVLVAAVALGVTQLAAGLIRGRSLVVTVGDWVIAHAPRWLVAYGKRTFGTGDKRALVLGIVIVALIFGALLGLVSRGTPIIGAVGIAVFGVAGVLAATTDPQASVAAATVAATAGCAAGTATLVALRPSMRPDRVTGHTDASRRAFLRVAVMAATAAGASAIAGRTLLEHSTRVASAARKRLRMPRARHPVPPPNPAMSVGVDGVTPLITTNDSFYRIDTALSYPRIDYEQWRLRINGMVARPVELTFDELAAMPLVEQYVTIGCVSNEVGGNLVSTAAWRGVLLRDLLAPLGVDPRADQVIGRSVDEFTVGFPTSAALDDRGAMVAIAMNDQPLPIAHGFPARLIVPGLYGYVSATKWLANIELATFAQFDAYWVERGWAQQAPIKTQSRIDVPSNVRPIRAGKVPIAGVAWAPTRGITAVEVQIDKGAWHPARLANALSTDTWRQWIYEWEAIPGPHDLRVRATDGTHNLQDGRDHAPEPDGATGYHNLHVFVVA